MKLGQLLKTLPVKRVENWAEQEIEAITADSRQVGPGTLFVAIPGLTVDGHRFVPQAAAQGAAAIVTNHFVEGCLCPQVIVRNTQEALPFLAARFYGDPTQRMRMIGITGTKGKTTTSFLVDYLLNTQHRETALVGTVQMRIGKRVVPSKMTTPDAVTLQRFFAEAAVAGVTHVVMEVSSHALVQRRVGGCSFDTAVFTNLSHDHLDFHKTLERYLDAKAMLFSQLGSSSVDSLKGRKVAILNADDSASERILESVSVPTVTYGITHPADISANDLHLTPSGTRFVLGTPQGRFDVSLPLVGMFNVYNTLAAVSVGLSEGLDLGNMINELGRFGGVPGRFERIQMGQDFTVIVDYAHTPDSLRQVLETIRGFARGKIIVAFGCTGDRDRLKRPIMGEIAARLAEYVIITSDDPHGEEPEAIAREVAAGVRAGGKGESDYDIIVDRHEAIVQALRRARPGDVVLIAGKGHEQFQVYKDYAIPFVDQDVIRGELSHMGWGRSALRAEEPKGQSPKAKA
ncbi:MAG: UDP-N-acetylmuramoyl-L-alanyl-D-glutamate--2,6-diaminopimelate ligase [Bacillota bacterium]